MVSSTLTTIVSGSAANHNHHYQRPTHTTGGGRNFYFATTSIGGSNSSVGGSTSSIVGAIIDGQSSASSRGNSAGGGSGANLDRASPNDSKTQLIEADNTNSCGIINNSSGGISAIGSSSSLTNTGIISNNSYKYQPLPQHAPINSSNTSINSNGAASISSHGISNPIDITVSNKSISLSSSTSSLTTKLSSFKGHRNDSILFAESPPLSDQISILFPKCKPKTDSNSNQLQQYTNNNSQSSSLSNTEVTTPTTPLSPIHQSLHSQIALLHQQPDQQQQHQQHQQHPQHTSSLYFNYNQHSGKNSSSFLSSSSSSPTKSNTSVVVRQQRNSTTTITTTTTASSAIPTTSPPVSLKSSSLSTESLSSALTPRISTNPFLSGAISANFSGAQQDEHVTTYYYNSTALSQLQQQLKENHNQNNSYSQAALTSSATIAATASQSSSFESAVEQSATLTATDMPRKRSSYHHSGITTPSSATAAQLNTNSSNLNNGNSGCNNTSLVNNTSHVVANNLNAIIASSQNPFISSKDISGMVLGGATASTATTASVATSVLLGNATTTTLINTTQHNSSTLNSTTPPTAVLSTAAAVTSNYWDSKYHNSIPIATSPTTNKSLLNSPEMHLNEQQLKHESRTSHLSFMQNEHIKIGRNPSSHPAATGIGSNNSGSNCIGSGSGSACASAAATAPTNIIINNSCNSSSSSMANGILDRERERDREIRERDRERERERERDRHRDRERERERNREREYLKREYSREHMQNQQYQQRDLRANDYRQHQQQQQQQQQQLQQQHQETKHQQQLNQNSIELMDTPTRGIAVVADGEVVVFDDITESWQISPLSDLRVTSDHSPLTVASSVKDAECLENNYENNKYDINSLKYENNFTKNSPNNINSSIALQNSTSNNSNGNNKCNNSSSTNNSTTTNNNSNNSNNNTNTNRKYLDRTFGRLIDAKHGIMEYEGSPRRIGGANSPTEDDDGDDEIEEEEEEEDDDDEQEIDVNNQSMQLMYQHNVNGKLSSSNNSHHREQQQQQTQQQLQQQLQQQQQSLYPARPGFPQRIISTPQESPPPPPLPPVLTKQQSLTNAEDTSNDVSEIGTSSDMTTSEPPKSSTFDYLYEFSETRKVLEEFFKCPSTDDKPIENGSDVDSIDIQYEFRNDNLLDNRDTTTTTTTATNNYIGQRLAGSPIENYHHPSDLLHHQQQQHHDLNDDDDDIDIDDDNEDNLDLSHTNSHQQQQQQQHVMQQNNYYNGIVESNHHTPHNHLNRSNSLDDNNDEFGSGDGLADIGGIQANDSLNGIAYRNNNNMNNNNNNMNMNNNNTNSALGNGNSSSNNGSNNGSIGIRSIDGLLNSNNYDKDGDRHPHHHLLQHLHNQPDIDLFLDSTSRSSGDLQCDNLMQDGINQNRIQSRNFRYSPETTDYDSNCGDLDSLSGEFNGMTNYSNYAKYYAASMPVLEDGLSSGHASDTENNNPLPGANLLAHQQFNAAMLQSQPQQQRSLDQPQQLPQLQPPTGISMLMDTKRITISDNPSNGPTNATNMSQSSSTTSTTTLTAVSDLHLQHQQQQQNRKMTLTPNDAFTAKLLNDVASPIKLLNKDDPKLIPIAISPSGSYSTNSNYNCGGRDSVRSNRRCDILGQSPILCNSSMNNGNNCNNNGPAGTTAAACSLANSMTTSNSNKVFKNIDPDLDSLYSISVFHRQDIVQLTPPPPAPAPHRKPNLLGNDSPQQQQQHQSQQSNELTSPVSTAANSILNNRDYRQTTANSGQRAKTMAMGNGSAVHHSERQQRSHLPPPPPPPVPERISNSPLIANENGILVNNLGNLNNGGIGGGGSSNSGSSGICLNLTNDSPIWVPRHLENNNNSIKNNCSNLISNNSPSINLTVQDSTSETHLKSLSADEEEVDTDLETDRLLGHQRLDDQGFYDENKAWNSERKSSRSLLGKFSPKVQSQTTKTNTSSLLRQGLNSLLPTTPEIPSPSMPQLQQQQQQQLQQSPTLVSPQATANTSASTMLASVSAATAKNTTAKLLDIGGSMSSASEHSEKSPDKISNDMQNNLVESPEGSNKSKSKDSDKKTKKSKNKEDGAVLIEGVLFRARYLGSTQLVCEGQPTKSTRMMQAEEAVSRIKAPDGDPQPSTEVDLFISTEKIMVLNTDLKEIMMDHALRTISYIADIGDLVVLMARRRFVPSDIDDGPKPNRTPKMICHVFESDEAQFIAQSIGQAFQVAYMEFLKANGIEDHSFVKEMDYQEVLNSQEIFGDELEIFAKKELQKEVVVPKAKGEILGVVIVESGWGSMLPTVVIANLMSSGAAARCGQLNIGDQLIAINGLSLVGLPLSTCQTYIKNSKNQTVVKFTVVPCPPVVEVKIKRPNTKYQLGFSVQNGVICSLLRGGIAERGGVRVGHRIIEINNQSVVAVPHEKIVNLLATSVGEILMKTMPTSMFRLLTGQENPIYI